MESKLNNNQQSDKMGDNSGNTVLNTTDNKIMDGTKPKTTQKPTKEDDDIIPTYLQQKDMGYSKPRKLSGPNNKVPTNLLSGWKNKYGGQQEVMMEEEEEEEENS